MHITLKRFIVPGIPLAVLLVALCFAIWMSAFFGGSFGNLPTQNSYFVNSIQSYLLPNTLWSNFVSIGFVMLNAFLIAQINNRFSIIRIRTFLPIFVFLLLMSSWNETHIANGSHFSLTLIIFSLFHFLNIYRNPKATEMAFMSSMFIGVASLIINPLVYLIPIFWIGLMLVQSFSVRTFLATILGLLSPWLIYFSIFYFYNQQIDFSQFTDIKFSSEIETLASGIPRIIYISSLFVITTICIFGMYSITNSDAIRTRSNLNFILLLFISAVALAFVFGNHLTFILPIIALLSALIVSYPFSLKTSNFYSILFIIFIIVNIAYVISKYIII